MHFYLLAVSLYLLFFFFSSLFVSLLFVLYGVLILVLAFSFCSVLSKSVLVLFFAHSHACSKDTGVYTCFQAS